MDTFTSPNAEQTFYGDYNEQGVDRSLLQWMLQLSPLERLQVMERHARDTEMLLAYGRKHREAKSRGGRAS